MGGVGVVIKDFLDEDIGMGESRDGAIPENLFCFKGWLLAICKIISRKGATSAKDFKINRKPNMNWTKLARMHTADIPNKISR